MGIGCSSVATMMILPNPRIIEPMVGPTRAAAAIPTIKVAAGVTTRSTLVSLDTILPSSVPITAATKAPAGPPPPKNPAAPVMAEANITRGGAFKPKATATPIAAPTSSGLAANCPTSTKKLMPSCSPSTRKIRPTIREENRPRAMAPNASTPYRCKLRTTFFLARNAPRPLSFESSTYNPLLLLVHDFIMIEQ